MTTERTTAPSALRDRGPRPLRSTRPGRPRYMPKRKVCFYCANKNEVIDYKNPDKLRSFLSDRAKIEPRRRSGTCARHQRALATAIKRARHLALMPFVPEHSFPAPIIMPASQAASTPAPAAPPPASPPQSDR